MQRNNQVTFNFDDLIEEQTFYVSHVSLRPIHYLGSKLRIVDIIRELVDEVDESGGPVCDLFAGSGTVSLALSSYRTVIAVDIQEYSRVLCSALLNPPRVSSDSVKHFLKIAFSSEHSKQLSWAIEPIVEYEKRCRNEAELGNIEPLCQFLEYGSIITFQNGAVSLQKSDLKMALLDTVTRLQKTGLSHTPNSLATRYFGGIYFSFTQASQIDMLLEAKTSLPIRERDLFLAAILSTTSESVNTVGKQFAQPIRPRYSDGRPKKDLAKRIARDRNISIVDTFTNWIYKYIELQSSGRKHHVIRCDYAGALERLKEKMGVIYADPPYTRDHYSRYYHVLETLCLRDCPSVSTVRLNGNDLMSRGIYRAERYQSPFCIKSKAPNAFSVLFKKASCLNVPLILSYSPFEKNTEARPRLMSINDIVDLARKSYRTVDVTSAGKISHCKLNRADVNKNILYNAETFIVCRP